MAGQSGPDEPKKACILKEIFKTGKIDGANDVAIAEKELRKDLTQLPDGEVFKVSFTGIVDVSPLFWAAMAEFIRILYAENKACSKHKFIVLVGVSQKFLPQIRLAINKEKIAVWVRVRGLKPEWLVAGHVSMQLYRFLRKVVTEREYSTNEAVKDFEESEGFCSWVLSKLSQLHLIRFEKLRWPKGGSSYKFMSLESIPAEIDHLELVPLSSS